MMFDGKRTVSQGALIKRINRRLDKQDERLKTTRGDGRARYELGDHWVFDYRLNAVIHTDVDLESFGRELEVLQRWECLGE